MLRIAICDDMPEFLRETSDLICRWRNRPEFFTVETFSDADALIAAHAGKPFDILFLDVVMPLLSGIEAAREIRQTDRSVKIVFLTSSAEFAVESYTVKADNYLLKPVSPEALFRCLDELQADILENSRCIIAKGPTSVHRVPFRDIEYIEAQNKQVLFFLANGGSVSSTEPLYSLENKLLFSDGFFKCHRSYIVNFQRIETYTPKEIRMRSGCRIPISRGCQKEFESVYFSYLFGKAGDNG